MGLWDQYAGGLLGLLPDEEKLKRGLLSPEMSMAIGARLMGARKGEGFAAAGQGAMEGLQLQHANRKSERETRAGELQQLSGIYKMLKDQDSQARMESQFTGRPYQPHPALQQVEQRLMGLASAPPMAGGSRPTERGPRPASALPLPFPSEGPGSEETPANSSPAPRTELPNATLERAGINRGLLGNGGMSNGPAPQQNQPQPADLVQMARAAGIEPNLAVAMIQAGKTGELYKQIAKALAPQNGPAGISRIDPGTGEVQILGGMASPGQTPWAMRNGQAQAMPVQGMAEEVARAKGLETSAVEAARAPYSFQSHPTGPGGAPQVMSVDRLRQLEGGNPGGRESKFRTPQVGQLTVTEPSRMGGGLSGPNPIETRATEGLNDDFIKNGYRPIMDAARSADAVLARVGALQRNGALDKTGWGMTQRAYAANLLGAFGVKDAQAFAGDAQTFNKFLMDTNWELLNQAKGPQTEGDAQRALQTFAQLGNTPQANKFILDFTSATQKLVKEKAKFYSDAARGNRADLSAIEGAWMERAPSLWDMPELRKWDKQRLSGPGNAPSGSREAMAGQVLRKNMTATHKAREAIRQGKDPEQVRQRLIESGYDPEGL